MSGSHSTAGSVRKSRIVMALESHPVPSSNFQVSGVGKLV